MPYMTKNMADYIKEKGLSNAETEVDEDESNSNDGSPKRKLRELPSAVESTVSAVGYSKASLSSSASSSKSLSSNVGASISDFKGSSKGSFKNGMFSMMNKSKGWSTSSISKSSSSRYSSNHSSCSSDHVSKNFSNSFDSSCVPPERKSWNKLLGKTQSSSSKFSKTSFSKTRPDLNKRSSSSFQSSSDGYNLTSKKSVCKYKFDSPHKNLSFDEKMLLYITGLLRSNVARLKSMDAAQDAQTTSDFNKYQIDEASKLPRTPMSKVVVKAKHKSKDFGQFQLNCKIYDTNKINPHNSMYLKILRLLGKKHPHIIQTWDIFYKKNNVYVIQESFSHGSVEEFLKRVGILSERQCQHIVQQLSKVMDYLGDMGVAHRSISPGNIFVMHREPVQVKLGGFEMAVVYWNPSKETVINVPCISRVPREPEFQAPEVYGDENKEEFDPVNADIWSLGACGFYIIKRGYPYDITKHNPQIENEIQNNIKMLKVSKKGHDFLSRILTTDAASRMPFEKIHDHQWMKFQD